MLLGVIDPHQPGSLVAIPPHPADNPKDSPFPPGVLSVAWESEGGRDVLRFHLLTTDKILPPDAARNLAGAPPPPPAPSDNVALSGAAPLWLFGTYARWLLRAGATRLASWDGRTREFIHIL